MKHQKPTIVLYFAILFGGIVPSALSAEETDGTTEEVVTDSDDGLSEEQAAKAAQNPLSSAVSMPFQNNTGLVMGGSNRANNVLNIQPIFPIPIRKVLLVNRLVLPVVYQPDTEIDENGNIDFADKGGEFGLADLTLTTWLTPAKQGKVLLGGGPVFSFPSATVGALKTKQFGIGPAAVLVATPGKWLLGLLAQNLWSVAGAADGRDINSFLLQYFINYNLPHGIYLQMAPIITADWTSPNDNRWTLPVGGGVGKIVKLGKMPINLQLSGYYNVITQELGPKWTIRTQIQFFLPSPFAKKSSSDEES